MVHASLRAVGKIDEGAEGLVRTLLSILGKTGMLVAYVDFEPTPELPYFDPRRSPASRDYGILAEVIRTWPGAVRSLNPGASMVAIGAYSQWLCSHHPLHFGYGEGSPLAKLVEVGGKVLLLGSDFDNVTLLHYAESRADLPNKRIIRRTDKVRSGQTIIDVVVEEFDTSEPVLSAMPEHYFAEITQQFIDSGQAHLGIVGQANSVLMSAKVLVDFAINKVEREYGI